MMHPRFCCFPALLEQGLHRIMRRWDTFHWNKNNNGERWRDDAHLQQGGAYEHLQQCSGGGETLSGVICEQASF